MRFVAKTDIGMKRKNNEDSLFANIYDADTSLYIVADGLGGYASGEVASQMLVNTMSNYFENHRRFLKNASDLQIEQVLQKALNIANESIYELEKTDEKYKGMGTTVVALLKLNSKIYYISIGDSRMYYIDAKMSEVSQITEDDTYVNELIKTNVINPSEAETHPQKHVLTKAIGIFKHIDTVVNILEKENGFVLLCTDGVTNMLDKKEILNIFKKNKFENVAQKLITKANDNGGVDNITAIAIEL
ncbi:MAG: Stp1/IreP family PP2C-type Ser/Thr phosphatase [Clostridia bacterium]